MKISVNTIRGITERYKCASGVTDAGVDALAEKIGAQLGAIEEIEDLGKKYHGVLIAKVVSCEPHANSDHLHVCKVDDGGKAEGVERDADGYVQVVCGAPNVREGLLVVWLPPGTTVPESVDKDPFVLGARELRGVMSNGMLASPRELALGDSHEGILEIDAEGVQPGDDFAQTFGLAGDYVLDIENKMFTHRPDCFGFLGVARELAGIQGLPFVSPDWYKTDAAIADVDGATLPLVVRNELPEVVPRFMAVAMQDVQVGPSPTWLQVELAKVGLRSINNIVDYTNFFMLLTGQPLHAYDYDKVLAQDVGADTATLVVRAPRAGETITLLNGKTITPREEAVMIATEQKLIGVGGVMGGQDTEVDESTTRIILEVATFDMYNIRRTSMAHGLFTDAVTRFNKGQSPLQNRAVLAKIVGEIQQHAGGKVASKVFELREDPKRTWVHPPVPVTVQFINERLGFELKAADMKQLLQNVECQVAVHGDTLTVTAPFWRTDIETREDVVEEVGRLYGFDKLPLELPRRGIMPAQADALLTLKSGIRALLAKAGANEVLTYSFVHGNLLEVAGQDASQAYQIGNALSPDLQYYRMSLTPSLLEKVHMNVKAGYDTFALFELGKAHIHGQPDSDEPEIPAEKNALSLVYTAKKPGRGAAYYEARAFLGALLHEYQLTDVLRYKPLSSEQAADPWVQQMVAPYEPGRSAVLVDAGSTIWGVVGEYKASVRGRLKLPESTAGFELDPTVLLTSGSKPYVALPRFPKVTQDITLRVGVDVPFADLFTCVRQAVKQASPAHTLPQLTPVDIYQPVTAASTKNVSLRLSTASYERTLTDAEVSAVLDAAAKAAASAFSAEHV